MATIDSSAVNVENSAIKTDNPAPTADNGAKVDISGANVNDSGVKVVLYWLEQSRAHRILWLMEELKVPYEVKVFKRTKKGLPLAPPELKEVHPLGKSPVIGVQRAGHKELIIAESAFIIEYLIDHWGPHLKPKRYLDGQEGQIGAETEAYMRDRWFMHMSEGSLMPMMINKTLVMSMRGKSIPGVVRPLTSFIAGKIENNALHPRLYQIFDYIEDLVKTAPDGGPFLCGKSLSPSDFMMSFPLQGAQYSGVITKQKYPKITEWIAHIENVPSYKAAVEKTKEFDGDFSLFFNL